MQLPAWNEALGLPRPWDQQWSLRIQQILAFESDLLEYDDIFEGSHVMEAKTDELVDAATAELDDVLDRGGAFSSVEELKTRLVKSQAARVSRIESREQMVVGVNCFTDSAPSPLPADSMLKLEQVESGLRADVEAWRRGRDKAAADSAVDALRRAAEDPGADLMEPTQMCIRDRGTPE